MRGMVDGCFSFTFQISLFYSENIFFAKKLKKKMPGRPRRSAQSNLPAKNVPIEEPANLNIKKDLPIGISAITKEEEKLAKQESPSMGTNIEPFIKGINEGEGTKLMDIGKNAEEKYGEKDVIGQQMPKANEFVSITQENSNAPSIPNANKPIRRRGAKPIGEQQMKSKIEQIEPSKLGEDSAKKNLMTTNKNATVEGGYSLRKRSAEAKR